MKDQILCTDPFVFRATLSGDEGVKPDHRNTYCVGRVGMNRRDSNRSKERPGVTEVDILPPLV